MSDLARAARSLARVGRISGRFLSGRPLDGRARTDSTFLLPGTRAIGPTGRASRWAMRAGWERAAWRVGGSALVVGEVCAYTYAPTPTLAVNSAAGLALTGYGAMRAHRAARRFTLNRRVVQPLWRALAPGGFPLGARADDWLSVPIGYDEDQDAVVTLRLPERWQGTAEQRRAVKDLLSRKLGGEWDSHWTDIGSPSLRLTHSPVPPSRVFFADVLPIIRELPEGRVLLGLGSRSEPIVIDFNAETPHVAMNIGTGGGKSSTLCLLIVQLLAQGATIEGIDPKRVSLNPLRGLPGIRIHRDIGQQWDSIALIRATMDQRYVELDKDENATFDRLVLVIEESNTFAIDSADYWEQIKEKSDPKTPRIFRDLNAILNKGRQVNVNVISVFQRMEAGAAGGSAARDQYGMKILARFSPQAWKVLVDTYPRPKSSKHIGRAIVADGNEHRVVQTAYALDPSSSAARLAPEALAYVKNARRAGSGTAVPGAGVSLSKVSQDGTELANLTAHTLTEGRDVGSRGVSLTPQQREPEQPASAEPTRYSLADAAGERLVPVKYDALRKARSTDADFPIGETGSDGVVRYTAEELVRWYNNRPRTTDRIALPSEREIPSATVGIAEVNESE